MSRAHDETEHIIQRARREGKTAANAELPLFSQPAPGDTQRMAGERAQRVAPAKRLQILNYIRAHGPVTRLQIAAGTAIGENTVNGRVHDLLEAKAIKVVGLDETTGRELVAAA